MINVSYANRKWKQGTIYSLVVLILKNLAGYPSAVWHQHRSSWLGKGVELGYKNIQRKGIDIIAYKDCLEGLCVSCLEGKKC